MILENETLIGKAKKQCNSRRSN